MTAPDDGRVIVAEDVARTSVPSIPDYLRSVYSWAYIDPRNVRLLDREAVVEFILFGNGRRLRRALLAELENGQRVLQAANVYGCLIPEMAKKIGPGGFLDVIDIVPLQAANCRRNLAGQPQARVRIADAERPGPGQYDRVSSFFLLHELPDQQRRNVVNALLDRVAPGGKAVFVDYHRPKAFHPLRWLLAGVFKWLEPFAFDLWTHEIAEFATHPARFQWRTRAFFGGLYQITTATAPRP